MSVLRVLIADDEPLANKRLAKLLDTVGGIEIVGQVTNGQEALDAIGRSRPDLAFLDIEMPRLDGFDVVEALGRQNQAETPPLFVFVTAFPDFAARAFDTGAADFLSKPVRFSRLHDAILRARSALHARDAERRLSELQSELSSLRSLQEDSGHMPDLWVRQGKGIIRVDLGEIERVEAEGEYVRLHGEQRSYLQQGPIGTFLENEAADCFIRVHRSHAVRADRVRAVTRNSWGGSVLEMQSGELVPVGRKFRDRLGKIYATD